MSKKLKKQVKKVSWFDILWKLGQETNHVLLSDFDELKFKRKYQTCIVKRRKPMSNNKAAYCVLRRHYSTTTLKWLKSYFEVFGDELQ